MMIKQTFANNKNGNLYIIATPIGNLGEITFRSINILKEADFIYCEDTRVTIKLLNHLKIHKPLFSLHKFNEKSQLNNILAQLKSNKQIVIVSDAGYPLISDPGREVIEYIINNSLPVVVSNGPSALLHALVVSKMPTSTFSFFGFLKAKTSQKRQSEFKKLSSYYGVMIFYESPRRIITFLNDVKTVFGEVYICVAKELTKIHETFYYGNVTTVISDLKASKLLGEFVVLIHNEMPIKNNSINNPLGEDPSIRNEILFLKQNFAALSNKDIINMAVHNLNYSKKIIYSIYNKMLKSGDIDE